MLLAFTMTLAIGLVGGSASASRSILLETAGRGAGIRFTMTAVEFSAALTTIRCEVRLSGELGTLAAGRFTAGERIRVGKASADELPAGVFGRIIRGEAVGCTESFGGAAEASFLANATGREILFEYTSFTGTLPEITSVGFNMLGFAIRITSLAVACLYEGIAAAFLGETAGGITYRRVEIPSSRLALIREPRQPEMCAAEVRVRFRANVSTVAPAIDVQLL